MGGGADSRPTASASASASGGVKGNSKNRVITVEEVNDHRTPGDAWVYMKDKVYDVSDWQDHPGGSVIFTHAGDDITDVFAAFHPASANNWLEKFEIGTLKSNVPKSQTDFEKGYRDLRLELIKMGMFKSSKLFYVWKVLSNLLIAAASIYCAVSTTDIKWNFLGACLMGLFWQQCGWLAHDFLHHQVFQQRWKGDLAGVMIGNLFQGFSVQWWKCKHNSHHAVPNLHASSPEAADGDPDIDTMPILAWTLRMAEQAKESSFGRFMIKWQAVFYFPVLLFARIAWAHQSWVYVFGGWGAHSVKGAENDRKKMAFPLLERLALIGHYIILGSIMYHMTFMNAAMYFMVSQTSCGLFLATVFGLGHNGMAVYPADERPDFWTLQISTTRNITGNFLSDWFCGGLQYQVDHHLFPQLPRHNLPKVHKMVEAFCKSHSKPYHEANMWNGTIEVLTHLSEVSTEFLHEFPAM